MNPSIIPLGDDLDTQLMPGEWAIRTGDGMIGTLLGSCIAVTIWDPVTATGACCHFLLPGTFATSRRPDENSAKYGAVVIPEMWRSLRTRGIPPERCVHKIFRGGRMFSTNVGDIGGDNIACARHFLREAGMAVTAESVGD